MVKLINSPVGTLTLEAAHGFVTGCYFGEKAEAVSIRASAVPVENTPSSGFSDEEVLELCEEELKLYFDGKLREFTVPFFAHGTAFRRRVWEELCHIPYGKTASYLDIAKAIGSPKAVRAVGGANHNNPISIIIPCHRVIGADGGLVGYGGGLETKKQLLELEASNRLQSVTG